MIMKDGFSPELSPKEMLEMGVFGGWYFGNDIDEYPKGWFKKAKISKEGFGRKIKSFWDKIWSITIRMEIKGWIFREDPLGWFQWYCRYTMGRRIPVMDRTQIERWKAFGPRHIGGIKKNCKKGDHTCRKRQRQALLQWGYNPFF